MALRAACSSLEIKHLVRISVKEPFQALSVGGCEQVAVVKRQAFTDALLALDGPAPVILDDALVNAAGGRLERMHPVPRKAARTLQMLALT